MNSIESRTAPIEARKIPTHVIPYHNTQEFEQRLRGVMGPSYDPSVTAYYETDFSDPIDIKETIHQLIVND